MSFHLTPIDTPPMTATHSDNPSEEPDDAAHNVQRSLPRMPGRWPNPSGGTGNDGDPLIFPPHLFDRPSTIFVYGASRSVVNLTLYALASEANPEFFWVELGEFADRRDPLDPVHLGWIPQNRLWLVGEPDPFRRPAVSGLSRLLDIIRADESPESLDQFAEFLNLPDRSQEMFTSRDPAGRPGVVAVTDSHHLQGELSARRISSLLSVHLNAGVSLMVGAGESAGPLRDLFGFVFRLEGPRRAPGDWRRHQLVCEKGISSGPLGDLRPIGLETVPLLREVFSRAGSSA